MQLAGELGEQLAGHRERALGGDRARGGGVARRARLLDVDHGHHAHLEAALGLRELLREGLERRLRGAQRLRGGEHVEVALRHAQHQVLLRGAVGHLGARDHGVGTAEPLPLVPAKHGLAQARLPAPGIGADALVDVEDLDLRVEARAGVRIHDLQERAAAVGLTRLDLAAREQLRQQRGARLGLGLEGRGAQLGGLEELRIARRREIVDFEQVRGRRDIGAEPDAASVARVFARNAITVPAVSQQGGGSLAAFCCESSLRGRRRLLIGGGHRLPYRHRILAGSTEGRSLPATQTDAHRGRRVRAAVLRGVAYLALWLVIAGGDAEDLVPGLGAAALAAWASLRLMPPDPVGGSVRWLAALRLFARFVRVSVVAGLDVARRALAPRMRLAPGYVQLPAAAAALRRAQPVPRHDQPDAGHDPERHGALRRDHLPLPRRLAARGEPARGGGGAPARGAGRRARGVGDCRATARDGRHERDF